MPQPEPSPQQETGWFVYILRCSDRTLYTGITTDVGRRMDEHNAGTAARYTRGRRPVAVAYQEPHPSRSSALKRECAIKAMLRREKEALIRTPHPARSASARRSAVSCPATCESAPARRPTTSAPPA